MATAGTYSRWLVWLPAIFWAALIWELGSDAWSFSGTSRFLFPLIQTLTPWLEAPDQVRLLMMVRKLAHPTVYGVLAGLCLWAASRGHVRWGTRIALALSPVLGLAVADEWRQSLSTARTGAVFDVVLDVAGGLFVVALALVLDRVIGRRWLAQRVSDDPPTSAV